MREIREVLRLKYANDYSQRKIAKHCGIARSTVGDYLYRAKKAELSWPLPQDWDDAHLEHLLFGDTKPKNRERPLPEYTKINEELRGKHVSLFLLWEEYKEQYPEGYQYSQFCELYRQWRGRCDVVMRQEHRAGEKLFVDYCGDTVLVTNRYTGEQISAQIFVAVLGASNFTFAEATESQTLKDWVGSHVRAFRFFNGVPEIVVPDNLRSAVTKANRYEALLNSTYSDLAEHYNTCIIPARVRKPKDKAKAESGVLFPLNFLIWSAF